MSEAVYVRGANHQLLYINPAAERLTGWALAEMPGRKCYEIFGDADQACRDRCPIDRAEREREAHTSSRRRAAGARQKVAFSRSLGVADIRGWRGRGVRRRAAGHRGVSGVGGNAAQISHGTRGSARDPAIKRGKGHRFRFDVIGLVLGDRFGSPLRFHERQSGYRHQGCDWKAPRGISRRRIRTGEMEGFLRDP